MNVTILEKDAKEMKTQVEDLKSSSTQQKASFKKQLEDEKVKTLQQIGEKEKALKDGAKMKEKIEILEKSLETETSKHINDVNSLNAK